MTKREQAEEFLNDINHSGNMEILINVIIKIDENIDKSQNQEEIDYWNGIKNQIKN